MDIEDNIYAGTNPHTYRRLRTCLIYKPERVQAIVDSKRSEAIWLIWTIIYLDGFIYKYNTTCHMFHSILTCNYFFL